MTREILVGGGRDASLPPSPDFGYDLALAALLGPLDEPAARTLRQLTLTQGRLAGAVHLAPAASWGSPSPCGLLTTWPCHDDPPHGPPHGPSHGLACFAERAHRNGPVLFTRAWPYARDGQRQSLRLTHFIDDPDCPSLRAIGGQIATDEGASFMVQPFDSWSTSLPLGLQPGEQVQAELHGWVTALAPSLQQDAHIAPDPRHPPLHDLRGEVQQAVLVAPFHGHRLIELTLGFGEGLALTLTLGAGTWPGPLPRPGDWLEGQAWLQATLVMPD